MPQLSMPLFVSPDDVITRMQLDPTLNGIYDVVGSGIIGAQLQVQRILDSKFQRQSHDCLYQVDSDAFSGIQPGGMFRLEVPSGFIRADVPTVLTASAQIPVGTTAFDSYLSIDPSVSKVETGRGYILIEAGINTNQYVRVRCDTGFEDGTTPYPVTSLTAFDAGVAYNVGDQVEYNGVAYECIVDSPVTSPPALPTGVMFRRMYVPMEQIPADIYEAIMALVPVIFDSSQNTNRNAEAKDQYKNAAERAQLLLQSYTRTKGFTFRPIWTA